jgi:endo-1,4-beta-xylanase
MNTLVFLLSIAPAAVFAQAPLWGQCKSHSESAIGTVADKVTIGGGQGWTGATTCVSGAVCKVNK